MDTSKITNQQLEDLLTWSEINIVSKVSLFHIEDSEQPEYYVYAGFNNQYIVDVNVYSNLRQFAYEVKPYCLGFIANCKVDVYTAALRELMVILRRNKLFSLIEN